MATDTSEQQYSNDEVHLYRTSPISKTEWTSKNKTLLGRSCVGEAGFDAVDECAAIAWIYAKRARAHRWPLSKMMRRYSAALKPHERHRRPWLFELELKGTRPRSWPAGLSWRKHRILWGKLLAMLDRWARGEVQDPLPDADHFGSRQDARRALYVRRWYRLETPAGFRNWFFDSSKKVKFRKIRSGRGYRTLASRP
jgi:hypothetical protein